jgi:hypothetical protein
MSQVNLSININDKVKAELTPYGKSIWIYSLEPYCTLPSSKQYLKELKESMKVQNIYEFQLHELMQIFGSQLYNGNPNQCFINNEIVLECK